MLSTHYDNESAETTILSNDHKRELANLAYDKSLVYENENDLNNALAYNLLAIKTLKNIPVAEFTDEDNRALSDYYFKQGTYYDSLNNTSQARVLYMRALNYRQHFTLDDLDDRAIATAKIHIARTYSKENYIEDELLHYHEAIAILEKLVKSQKHFNADYRQLALCYFNLAEKHPKQKDWIKRIEFYISSLASFQQIPTPTNLDKRNKAYCFDKLSCLHTKLKRHSEAYHYNELGFLELEKIQSEHHTQADKELMNKFASALDICNKPINKALEAKITDLPSSNLKKTTNTTLTINTHDLIKNLQLDNARMKTKQITLEKQIDALGKELASLQPLKNNNTLTTQHSKENKNTTSDTNKFIFFKPEKPYLSLSILNNSNNENITNHTNTNSNSNKKLNTKAPLLRIKNSYGATD